MFRVNDITIWTNFGVSNKINTTIIVDIILTHYKVMTFDKVEELFRSSYFNSSDNLYTDIFT